MTNIDFRPLSSVVTAFDIKKYKESRKPLSKKWLVYRIFIAILLVWFFVRKINEILNSSEDREILIPFVVFGALILIGASLAFYFYAQQEAIKSIRFMRFADQNGLKYGPTKMSPSDGILFNIGHSKIVSDVFSKEGSDGFEIANYEYTIGSGKNSRTFRRAYICMGLLKSLPNMVLDSKANNTNIFGLSITNLPTTFMSGQKLSLEGDFNNHFTLYAPKDYERDALFIFTPDLMAQFIDKTGDFDAEIVDSKLYIYSSKPFNYFDVNLFSRLFHIIDTVMVKTSNRSHGYVDERVDQAFNEGSISIQGQRLKKFIPISVSIAVIVYILAIIFKFIDLF